ncbi:pseudouridine synthase [Synechococcus sp. UW140]|uniref:pseudouridine synthase n=1 Tax=Synechococcus sp. UW140 TaxID=368503 RepID=UPI0025E91899|nr:pseudouridine synthase [Synechococcus sp. UW140]
MLLHKPYGVLSQFRREPGSSWESLASLVAQPGVYAAGRLDADSEGLLILTANGALQHRLTDPRWGHWRYYWVQVEGSADQAAIEKLQLGIQLKDGISRPARARLLQPSEYEQLPARLPPIRQRLTVPTSWIELGLQEGRNRQVRRMSAAVGLPTLRLIRVGIDLMDGAKPLNLEGLAPGQWRSVSAEEENRLERLNN